MQDTAQELAFADELIADINNAQNEIEQLEKVAKARKEMFATKIDEWLAESIVSPQTLIAEKTAMLQPIIQKQLED